MGYEVKRTIFVLKFEDPAMEGLVVRARKPSMGRQLDMMRFRDLANASPEELSQRSPEEFHSLLSFFIGFLDSWNLTENGVPVPCNIDGLLDQEDELIGAIISAWVEAVSTVSTPLEEKSRNGWQSEVVSIPTETLSGSRSSLPGQS